MNEQIQSVSEKLKKFTYVDNSIPNQHTVIFECETTDILEADKLYQAETGKDPREQQFVGCRINKVEI